MPRTRGRPTLRRRLALLVTVAVGGAVLISGVVSYGVTKTNLTSNIDRSLRDNATQESYARTVLHNLLVLQAPSSTDAGVTAADSSYAATLRVSVSQAQTLFFVTKNGDWTLSLRPAVRAADGKVGTSSIRSILGHGA